MQSDLLQTEGGLTNWLSISFFITTLAPAFFTIVPKDPRHRWFQSVFYLILMSMSVLIIVLSIIPFYYRHKDDISRITDPAVLEREHGIFIGQLVFLGMYLALSVMVWCYMLYYSFMI
jgi:hypothetical protein